MYSLDLTGNTKPLFRMDDSMPAPWYGMGQIMIRRQANADMFRRVMLASALIGQDPDGALSMLAGVEAQMPHEQPRTPSASMKRGGRARYRNKPMGTGRKREERGLPYSSTSPENSPEARTDQILAILSALSKEL